MKNKIYYVNIILTEIYLRDFMKYKNKAYEVHRALFLYYDSLWGDL